MRTDRVEEFLAREWFGDVLLGADDAPSRLVEKTILRGQHDHRRALEHLVVLDQRAGLIAVLTRHHDVYEDDLRLLIGDLGERLEAVGRGDDLAAFLAQQRLGGPADRLRVVDDHDLDAGQAALFRVIHLEPPATDCLKRITGMRKACRDRTESCRGMRAPGTCETATSRDSAFLIKT